MGLFFCARCDCLRDADSGCEEAPAALGKFRLICAECALEMEDEAERAQEDRHFAEYERRNEK